MYIRDLVCKRSARRNVDEMYDGKIDDAHMCRTRPVFLFWETCGEVECSRRV
jgi:hypothetical protein